MTREQTKAMDDLIAQDADLIDTPLAAAMRELLTDDSMEHLDTFTHNLVQAFNKHGLKVVSADYLDNLNDTVRGLRQDIKAEQKHTDNALDNMDAAYRRCERLRTGLSLIAHHISNEAVSFEEYYECCRSIARAALAGDSHGQ